jgi:hypothetical protein
MGREPKLPNASIQPVVNTTPGLREDHHTQSQSRRQFRTHQRSPPLFGLFCNGTAASGGLCAHRLGRERAHRAPNPPFGQSSGSAQLRRPRPRSALSASRRLDPFAVPSANVSNLRFETFEATSRIDPERPFRIGPTTGRYARKSGPRSIALELGSALCWKEARAERLLERAYRWRRVALRLGLGHCEPPFSRASGKHRKSLSQQAGRVYFHFLVVAQITPMKTHGRK